MGEARDQVLPAAGVLPGASELSYDAELILGAIPDGVFCVDLEGRATLVNEAAARLLGWTQAELVGSRIHDVIHNRRPDGSPYPSQECPIHRALVDGEARQKESDTFWRKDGSSMPVEFDCRPIVRHGAIVGVLAGFRDLSEKQRAEERTSQLIREQFARAKAEYQHAQLRDVLVQAPALICLTRGPQHVIETINELYSRAIGEADVVGKAIREAFPGAPSNQLAMIDRAYETGEPWTGSEVAGPFLGNVGSAGQFFNFVVQPLRDDTSLVYGLMVHAVDVTDLVTARRLVRVRADELARLARALEISNRELDSFAYAASHDLRAPLRGIANLAQWIEEDLASQGMREETREMLQLMRVRMHRMESLIEGLLEYSRAGRTRQRPERVDTARLVAEIVDLLSPPEEVVVSVAGDVPTFRTERLPLQQVLQNLISNAIKHARRDDPQITIAARDAGDFYEFSVADNGAGIERRYHDRIWGIFQTLETRDKVEGTGIGLALVKKLVDSQGGRAWVESEPGRGATFKFFWRKAQD
jgi:PAS domain S-box-containing protein